MQAQTTVLVAGGGPAGSMTAALLARESVSVTLVEKDAFPRYHIGESLLTSALTMMDFAGVLERVATEGFVKKYGGFFRIKQGEVPGHIDFTTSKPYRHSYQVVRSRFDEILFEHAGACGADIWDRTAVTGVTFRDDRPVAARLRGPDGAEQEIAFDFLIDATGQTGLLSAHHFRDRRAEPAFANVAVGGYFRGARPYCDVHGTEHPGAFSMEALTDGSGWTWAIPLHDGRLSVGVVLHRDAYQQRRRAGESVEAVFTEALGTSPDVTRLIRDARRDGPVRVWRDYSYFAGTYAGPGYRLAGDAAGFIDPLFSTGVHMAFLGALSSAATVCSELRGEADPDTAESFHHRFLSQAYARLAITVAGFYRQLRNQHDVVLPGVSGENLQLAFDLIQPIVSGDLDLGSDTLDEDTIHRAMRYTTDMMLEAHEVQTQNRVAKFMAGMDDERMAGRFAAIDGRYIRMKRGRLGIARFNRLDAAFMATRRQVIRRITAARR
jgi:flavin-dependent dehydrogenase